MSFQCSYLVSSKNIIFTLDRSRTSGRIENVRDLTPFFYLNTGYSTTFLGREIRGRRVENVCAYIFVLQCECTHTL